MALHHAAPGDIVDLQQPLPDAPDAAAVALLRTPELEVMRRTLEAGQRVPVHQVDGPIVFQCLQGSVRIESGGRATLLESGRLLWLEGGTPYALEAAQRAVLLMTLARRPG